MRRVACCTPRMASWLLVVLIICGLASPAMAAPTGGWIDVAEGHYARSAIDRWSDFLAGDDRNFYPSRPITRGRLMEMLVRTLGYRASGDNPFADVTTADPAYSFLLAAWEQGLLSGNYTADGRRLARAGDPLTRAEAAVFFQRAFSIPSADGSESRFTDRLPDWAAGAIYGLEAAGYVHGRSGTRFDSGGILSRAEAVQILDNIVRLYLSQPGEYSGTVNGSVLVNGPGVVLSGMNICGNLYLAAGIGDGAWGLIDVDVAGSTFVRGGGAGQISLQNSRLGRLVLLNGLALADLQSSGSVGGEHPGNAVVNEVPGPGSELNGGSSGVAGGGSAGGVPGGNGGDGSDGGAGGAGTEPDGGPDPGIPSVVSEPPGATIGEY